MGSLWQAKQMACFKDAVEDLYLFVCFLNIYCKIL